MNFKAFVFILSLQSAVWGVSVQISGEDVVTHQMHTFSVPQEKNRPLAVVFLSALCPCSNSHVEELKLLSLKYPQVDFVGIHSNSNETSEITQSYFKSKALPFSVIEDVNLKIADQLKAFKTPHAFLYDGKGEVVYRGGVTDSSDATKAKVHFLASALEDLASQRPVEKPEGRTLGCVIQRENEKNVW
jgi:hypothetical protein